jgi:hypothetical protein
MFKHVKMLLVALVALAAFASTASAVTVSPGGAITATSNGRLTLRSVLATTQCDVRLIGSINTSGTVGTRIGSVTSSSITNCLGGIAVTDLIATAGAWNLTLNSTAGSPVTSALVTISNVAFQLSSPSCLFTGSVGFNLTEPSAIALQANSLPSPRCGAGSLSGSFSLSPGQNIT